MKKTMIAVVLLVIAFVAAWGLNSIQAQPATVDANFKIAMVNVAKAMTSCQEYLDREKEMNERSAKIKADLTKLSDEIDALGRELKNVLEPLSSEFNTRMKEWFQKKADLKAMEDYQKEVLSAETQAWTETLYEKLLTATASVSRQEGVSLMLNKDDTPVKSRNLNDLFTLIRTRQVLYGAPTMEMTAQVIEKMDSAYEKEKTEKSKVEIPKP